MEPLQIPLPTIKIRLLPRFTAIHWLTLFAGLTSLITTYVFYRLNLIVAYNDARAHLNMARLVIDNLKPGFSQIGSVWLPLNHLLTLTLVSNDWLWHTGLAGAVWSMVSYVLATLVLYQLISGVVKDRLASLLGTLLFATNLNLLYMQSTPMTELLLLLFFTSATYFFYRWIYRQQLTDLLLTALSVLLATLTRYDGWFLLISITAIIPIIIAGKSRSNSPDPRLPTPQLHSSTSKKPTSLISLPHLPGSTILSRAFNFLAAFWLRRRKIEGQLLLFATLAGFGIGLWLLWNLVIFKDPLYFAFGPYSAHAQQTRIQAAGSLPTIFNLPLSLTAYWWAMVNNAGFLPLIFSLIGFTLFAFKRRLTLPALAVYTLWVPLIFHVVSLYLGHSILILPEMGVNVTQEVKGSWFNVRYGLMILPAVAFFSAYLASKDLLAKLALAALLIVQPVIFLTTHNIITITDGVQGTSSLSVGDVAHWLDTNAAAQDQLILTSISFNNALAFTTGMPLKKFIHEGTGKYWQTSLADPSVYATWIVMANGDVGDPVYDALVKQGNSAFLKQFSLRARFPHTNIYQRRQIPAGFAYLEGQEFYINGNLFRFIGVNSYDLIHKSPQQISQTLSTAKQAGVDVVRFWGFSDGTPDGIQPTPGVYSPQRLYDLDLVLAIAKQQDLKVIITLVNYWPDYGGIAQYLRWAGLPANSPSDLDHFFTNPETLRLYRQYLETILTRQNTITHQVYSQDPTIFAWELINEPRSSRPDNGSLVTTWLKYQANYLKTLDRAHLILAGHEGFIPGSTETSVHAGPWSSQVGDLVDLSALTGHYYLQGQPLYPNYRHPIVADWKRLADEVQKPLIIEEVGFSKNSADNQGIDRLQLYNNLLQETLGHGVQGVILWNWSLNIDNNYGISPLDPRDRQLIDLIKTSSAQLKTL